MAMNGSASLSDYAQAPAAGASMEITPEVMAAAAEETASVLRALSNPSRLLILCEMVEGERTPGQLEATLDLSQAYVSQQLARLRSEGLVSARRDGRQMRYSISDQRVLPLLQVIYEQYCPKAQL